MTHDLALQSRALGGGFDGTHGSAMRRVVVFGTTGSGKSTLAERLALQKGLRVIELDALYWGRNWQGAPVELFRYRVECETRDGDWIVVGNYGQVRDLVWRPADTLIWLDLPLSIVTWRLFRRTLRRVLSKEDLWGTGNRETWRSAFFSRQSILLWAWKTHRRNRQRLARECQSLAEQKRIVRLTSKRDVERFMTAA
jgi:adenylate kinase family enzyme